MLLASPLKAQSLQLLVAIISLQHIQVPIGDAPDVLRLHILQGDWLRLS